jgi:uroporphyrinogen decarboxylase
MNGRDRIASVLRFEEPDRLPIDLGGTTGASGIHVLAYAALRRYLGLPERPVRCSDVMQQLAVIDEDFRRHLQLDVIQISANTIVKEWVPYRLYPELDVFLPQEIVPTCDQQGTWLLHDAQGTQYRKPASSFYFDAEDGKSWYSYAPPLTDDFLRRLKQRTKEIAAETGCALAIAFGGGFLSSDPAFLMDLLEEPEAIYEQLNQRCEVLIERYQVLHETIGDQTFCVVFADDFGAQAGPMIGPELFSQSIVPHYRRFSEWLHQHTKWKLYLHSCGAIESLLEMIIDMGVDILNPIQTSARGMDPVLLNETYGGRIVFWGGGCDTQRVLGFLPTEKLAAHVRERVELFAPGGGFVFNQIHAIQPTVDPASIVAMFDAARSVDPYRRKGSLHSGRER